MKIKNLIMKELGSLPDEARQEAMDFIVFLRQQYCGSRTRRPVTTSSVNEDAFVGMWADRGDMKDSVKWVQETRERNWGR